MKRGLDRLVGGAAEGSVALGLLALVEIVSRFGREPHLSTPFVDSSALAIFGAGLGATFGVLRAVRGLEFISPFGVAFGLAWALRVWLDGLRSVSLADELVAQILRGCAHLLVGAAVGQLLGTLIRRRWPLKAHVPRDLAIVALFAMPTVLPAAFRPRAWVHDRPHVLLLTIDTLRADRLGFAGHPEPVSPYLDRLARQGIVARRAVTTLPRTLPAFATILTGYSPHTHGVRDNFHYRLGDDVETLAEAFASAGWSTAAVNSNPVLSHGSGIYQGFASANDRGDDWSRLSLVRGISRLRALAAMRAGDRAQVITDLALDWLDRRPRARPFFLWVHWLSPHMPYEPIAPFDRRFDPTYDGPYAHALGYDTISKGDMTYRNPLSERQRRHALALYDGEVATADRAVGRLLREMDLRGELDDTIVVFTSDHGESLLEHDYLFNHGDFVYGPAANVPVVWWGSPEATDWSKSVRSLTDLAPEIARIAGAKMETADDDGAGDRSIDARFVFGESGFCRFPHLNDRLGWQLPREVAQNPDVATNWTVKWEEQANRAKQRFVQSDRWKLVRSPRESGDVHELFDLDADPGETNDVAAEHPDIVDALANLLTEWVAAGAEQRSFAEDRVLDEATRRQMDALGYLGD